jgi:hypothetical protein
MPTLDLDVTVPRHTQGCGYGTDILNCYLHLLCLIWCKYFLIQQWVAVSTGYANNFKTCTYKRKKLDNNKKLGLFLIDTGSTFKVGIQFDKVNAFSISKLTLIVRDSF